MKPRLFIGSSTEKLNIAYAIQENLEHDSNYTVWTQGIFKLSNNALDDLVVALDNFDFAVMIFTPDDISQIRNSQFLTVRDNVVFELGLFIGRLGKDKVFFVSPKSERHFHLPTDLIGITGGTYDSQREDGNLKAALGPFCNQVRVKLENHIYENLNDLNNESKEAKRIAVEKPYGWEHLLSAELIRTKLVDINRSYSELKRGLVFQKTIRYDGNEYFAWFQNSLSDFLNLTNLLPKIFEDILTSFGPSGVAGKVLDIKIAADNVNAFCKELIAWEYRLQGIIPPDELQLAKEKMSGWTKSYITEINKIPIETARVIEASKNPNATREEKLIGINLKTPPGLNDLLPIFQKYLGIT